MLPERHDFETADALAGALATRVAGALAKAIAVRGAASLALSGGSTPRLFLSELSKQALDWARVTITLVDERWLGENDERSNAALLRRHLLVGPAAAATFVPLFTGDPDPNAGLPALAARLAAIPKPFAAVVLGMGTDGHTASWFPDADRLAEAIDPDSPISVLAIRARSAGEPRVTLTLPAALDTALLVLHIEGEAKRAALERALGEGPVADMPVRAVLRQRRVPVAIYWCP